MNQMIEAMKLSVLLSAGTRALVVLSPEVRVAWRRMPGEHSRHPVLAALPAERDASTIERIAQWIPDYVQNVGPFTPGSARLWPAAQLVMVELGVGVSGLNDVGASWPASISPAGCARPPPSVPP